MKTTVITLLPVQERIVRSPETAVDSAILVSLCISDELFVNGCYQRNGSTIIGMCFHR